MSKPVRTCQQILTNGHLCRCPAMRNHALCYYHSRDLQRRRILEKAREVKRGYDKHRESRPEDEFNSEIVESLLIPPLDDRASIQVACTNLMRAVYCDHISLAKARIMMRAITEANLNLRRGRILDPYEQPQLDADPEPILPLGHSDPDGCVLPEERMMKKARVDIRREQAARADAEIAAARARGENPPPRPLTLEEQEQAARDRRRAASDADFIAFYDDMLSDPSLSDAQRQRITSDRAALVSRAGTARVHPCESHASANGASAPASAQARVPVPHMLSEGHGFSRADSHPLSLSSRGSRELHVSDESRDKAFAVAPNSAQAREPVPQQSPTPVIPSAARNPRNPPPLSFRAQRGIPEVHPRTQTSPLIRHHPGATHLRDPSANRRPLDDR